MGVIGVMDILAKHLLPPVRTIFAAFREKFSAKVYIGAL